MIEAKRIRDFRGFFRPQDQINDLEKRGVCLVEIVGLPTAKGEVSIHGDQRLKDVIKLFRGSEYDGQVRVISRDSILQTPRVTYNPGLQEEIQVNPGDLVFIQARD